MKTTQFYREADFHHEGFGLVLLERRSRGKKKASVFHFLDAKIPAQLSHSIVEARVLNSIFAHSQHMAVTIH